MPLSHIFFDPREELQFCLWEPADPALNAHRNVLPMVHGSS
jgi:hypothetical protein